jgi:hypothetical protein
MDNGNVFVDGATVMAMVRPSVATPRRRAVLPTADAAATPTLSVVTPTRATTSRNRMSTTTPTSRVARWHRPDLIQDNDAAIHQGGNSAEGGAAVAAVTGIALDRERCR